MQYTKMRKAIAMIELIFALVVMGIVLMSAPMLISSSVKSSVVALQQEGINEAVSRVNMILTYPWDERNTNESCIPSILVTTQGDDELNATGGNSRRIGVPLATRAHSFKCQNNIFAASPIGSDPGDVNNSRNDLDDFTGDTTLQDVSSGTGGFDYIEKTTVRIANTINYISDSTDYSLASINYTPGAILAGVQTSNIKQIDITLTSSSGNNDLNKTIIFRAFSSNLGGIEYEGRTF